MHHVTRDFPRDVLGKNTFACSSWRVVQYAERHLQPMDFLILPEIDFNFRHSGLTRKACMICEHITHIIWSLNEPTCFDASAWWVLLDLVCPVRSHRYSLLIYIYIGTVHWLLCKCFLICDMGPYHQQPMGTYPSANPNSGEHSNSMKPRPRIIHQRPPTQKSCCPNGINFQL